jgi:four helix bundle protein
MLGSYFVRRPPKDWRLETRDLMRDYTKINAWKLADDLTVAVYEQTRQFPREELYALTSQIRRAAYSVPANIAEGSARESKRDYLHFLYISRSSLMETKYFVHLCHRLEFFNEDAYHLLDSQVGECFGCLHGLIQAVEREAGKLSKLSAIITSLIFVTAARWSLVPGL